MEIFLNILLLVFGIILLIKGADFFVDGSSNIARALKVPSLIIGLTLVSMGTSAPELSVSITSAFAKANDLSFGNVIGSNIFNVFMVIGISATMTPMFVSKDIQKIDIPILLFIYGVLIILGFVVSPLILEFWESIIIIALFVIYLVFLFVRSLKHKGQEEEENQVETSSRRPFLKPVLFIVLGLVVLTTHLVTYNFKIPTNEIASFVFSYISYFVFYFYAIIKNLIKKQKPEEKDNKVKKILINIFFVVFGLTAIILGGDFVVDSAKFIAKECGMSEVLIGLTIVAIGTSLPELVTSVVAAKKKENDIALGNALGSCVFNVLFILGISSAINPLTFEWDYLVDVCVMTFAVVLTLITTLKTRKINRIEGLICVAVYIGYTTYIIARECMF